MELMNKNLETEENNMEQSYNGTCILKIKYANMHMDRRSRKIIVEYVEFQFDGKKIEDFELRFLTNRVPDESQIDEYKCELVSS